MLARGDDGRLGRLNAPDGEPGGVGNRIVLREPNKMRVVVTMPDGSPAAGVRVHALAPYSPTAQGETGPDGTVSLAVPADAAVAQVLAMKPGLGFGYTLNTAGTSGYQAAPTPPSVSVALSPAWTHRVRCVEPDGTPVPGANVHVWLLKQPGRDRTTNMSGSSFAHATADATGTATFDWLPRDFENSISLWAGGADHSRVRVGLPADDPAAEQTVTLERRATLAGRVTNPDGSPAVEVMVRAEGQYSTARMSESDRQTTFTDSDGRYTLSLHPNAAWIVVPLPGSRTVYREEPTADWSAATPAGLDGSIVSRPGETLPDLDFQLRPGTHLTGTVTRLPDGDPVADLTVLLNVVGTFPEELEHPDNRFSHRSSMPRWTETDADGHYAFALGPGRYSVRTFEPQTGTPEEFEVVDRQPVTRDILLEEPPPPPPTLTGRVLDPHGEPVAGASLFGWYPDRERGVQEVRVELVADAEGRFTTERNAVPLTLAAATPDRTRTGVARVSATRGEVEVTVRTVAMVTGRALDAAGDPLAGVPIRSNLEARWTYTVAWNPFEVDAVTGPAGRFVLLPGVIPGERHKVWVGSPGGTSYDVGTVEPTPGALAEIEPVATNWPADERLPVAERIDNAFAEPLDVAAATIEHRAAAGRLGRRALYLIGDPRSAAGGDLFSAVYDDPSVAAAADAGYLTRCLAAARPNRTLDPLDRLGLPPLADGDAVLVAVTPDGRTAGVYRHEPGRRGEIAAFLAEHAP